MYNKSLSSKIRNIIIYVVVILLGLACFFPLINIVAISFSDSASVIANKVGIWPVNFTTVAYKEILTDAQFWKSFRLSVLRVFLALALNLVLVVPAAYALTKSSLQFKGRNIYMKLFIFAMMFNGGMIPTYILVRKLGLINTVWALVLPGAVPIFSIILTMNFFNGIPTALEEAAFIDGATPYQVLIQILIPCAKPCIATISLFSIVGSWNDFFSGLIYMPKQENYPIMTYIQSLSVDIQKLMEQTDSSAAASAFEKMGELSNKNLNAAKIVVAVIPLLIIYPFLQKYLITGMVVGSVKE